MMNYDRRALDDYITGHYGEDQELGEEDAPEEEARPMLPSVAIQQAIWELMHSRADWSDRDDPYEVGKWIDQRIAALGQAQRDLRDYAKIKAALAVLKDT